MTRILKPFLFLLPFLIVSGCATSSNQLEEPALSASIDEIYERFQNTRPNAPRNWRAKKLAFDARIVRFYNDVRSDMVHLSLAAPYPRARCTALITFASQEARANLMDNFYEGDLISVTGHVSDYSPFDPNTNCGIRIVNPTIVKIRDAE